MRPDGPYRPGIPSSPPVEDEAGYVEHATWLADGLLLIAGLFPAGRELHVDAALLLGDKPAPLEARCHTFARPSAPDAGAHAGTLLAIRLPKLEPAPLAGMLLRTAASTFLLEPLELLRAMTDLRTLLRETLAGLDAGTRSEAMAFLTAALARYRELPDHGRLAGNLFLVREALRERLPYCVNTREQPRGLQVDALLAVDESSFYIKGAIWDLQDEITRLVAVSPEGARTPLLEAVFRWSRSDLDGIYDPGVERRPPPEAGFIGYFHTEVPSYVPGGWLVEMWNAAGTACEVTAPPRRQDPIAVRRSILEDLSHDPAPGERLMRNHVVPAVSRLQRRLQEMTQVASVIQYGQPGQQPDISIIIALEQYADCLEHQLAQFVHDPEIAQADLSYVVGSPEEADGLQRHAAHLFQLYRVPFRLITLKISAGLPASINAAGSLARGRILLLLGPHVLPDKPGWLGRLAGFYDSTPGIGALGAKLMDAEELIRHAGISFSRPDLRASWEPLACFQGQHRRLPAADLPRPVPAVAGACLMIATELYRQLGGLHETFLLSDHAGSDLCLRLLVAQYENWYLPEAELYDLEEPPRSDLLRLHATRYDGWLHAQLWNTRLETVLARFEAPHFVSVGNLDSQIADRRRPADAR